MNSREKELLKAIKEHFGYGLLSTYEQLLTQRDRLVETYEWVKEPENNQEGEANEL